MNKTNIYFINKGMKKLCVIFGGASSEHDISIITGMQLANNLKNKNIEKIYLNLENKLFLASKIDDLQKFYKKSELNLKEVYFNNGAVYVKGIFNKKLFDVECVINCCHGGVGENGDLCAYLNLNSVKCTSANPLASGIAMNKSLTKKLVEEIVPVIKGAEVTKSNFNDKVELIKNEFCDDLIVKPNSLGSSIGVKACNKQNFTEQINAIFEMNDTALIEERIVDLVEYNQACFKDEDELIVSAIEQPLTKNNFLTFEDKYQNTSKGKGTDRIIPAKITKKLQEKISNYTKQIYTKLNMSGVVRIDYIFDKSTNTLYFNEINTIPGSMAFYLYEPIGIDYITLIEKIVRNAEDIKKFAYFETNILKEKKL